MAKMSKLNSILLMYSGCIPKDHFDICLAYYLRSSRKSIPDFAEEIGRPERTIEAILDRKVMPDYVLLDNLGLSETSEGYVAK